MYGLLVILKGIHCHFNFYNENVVECQRCFTFIGYIILFCDQLNTFVAQNNQTFLKKMKNLPVDVPVGEGVAFTAAKESRQLIISMK